MLTEKVLKREGHKILGKQGDKSPVYLNGKHLIEKLGKLSCHGTDSGADLKSAYPIGSSLICTAPAAIKAEGGGACNTGRNVGIYEKVLAKALARCKTVAVQQLADGGKITKIHQITDAL